MKQWLSSNASWLRAFLSHLDTPRSLAVWLMIENKEWDQLALSWVDPRHYPEGVFSALKYRRDVQAVDLLRKAPLPTTFDRRTKALEAWEAAETQCFITNEFILSLDPPGGSTDPYSRRLSDFLTAVKNRVARWLGPLPDDLDGGFGPGTCIEYEGGDPTVVDKLWLRPTTTPDAHQLFRWCFDRTLWGRQRWDSRFEPPGISRGNRLTTVPKDGKTDRPISIEPVGNLWLQLGIGKLMKARLELIGFEPYRPRSRELFPGFEYKSADAQQAHREFLLRCGPEGFSTIDLSSASDTVSLELVRRVIPPDWFQLLDDCRSKLTWVPSQVGGSWRHLEKFSSMGNGFTFELESIIFAALTSVAFGLTPGRDLLVFGDDIILPSRHFDAACNLLEAFGFSINRRKSYKDGPFYESCGGNVHSGIDVTPVRLKGPLEDPPEVYAFHNALYRRGFPRHVLRKVRDLVPRSLHFPGPSWAGDVVLHGLPYSSFPYKHRDGGCGGWRVVRSLNTVPVDKIPLERWSPELAIAALLLGSSTEVVRRRGRVVYRSALVSVS